MLLVVMLLVDTCEVVGFLFRFCDDEGVTFCEVTSVTFQMKKAA